MQYAVLNIEGESIFTLWTEDWCIVELKENVIRYPLLDSFWLILTGRMHSAYLVSIGTFYNHILGSKT